MSRRSGLQRAAALSLGLDNITGSESENEFGRWSSSSSSLPNWIQQHSSWRSVEHCHGGIDLIEYIVVKEESKQSEAEKALMIHYLSSTNFFGDFHPETLRALIPCIELTVCDRGDELYAAGESAENVYVLRSGAVELTTKNTTKSKATSSGPVGPSGTMMIGGRLVEEQLSYSESFGVERVQIQRVSPGQSFGADPLPPNFVEFAENNINVDRIEEVRWWRAIVQSPNTKVLSIGINVILKVFHRVQLQKSNQIQQWLRTNKLIKSNLTESGIRSLFEATSLRARKRGELIVEQGHRVEAVHLIISGRVRIEKLLTQQIQTQQNCDQSHSSPITFVLDHIDKDIAPFLGTEAAHSGPEAEYLFSARAESKRVEFLILEKQKMFLLFRSQEIRLWFFRRCFELQQLLHIATQRYYEDHTISTHSIGFPRTLSHRQLFHTENSNSKRTLIRNHSVTSIAPKKSLRRIKSGKELIHDITTQIKRRSQSTKCSALSLYD